MIILLGVFNSKTYWKLSELEGVFGYMDFISFKEWDHVLLQDDGLVLYEKIAKFCELSEVKQVYFVLDELMYPHSSASISCCELLEIYNSKTLLDKVIFFQEGWEVDYKEVISFLQTEFLETGGILYDFPKFTKIKQFFEDESESTMDSEGEYRMHICNTVF